MSIGIDISKEVVDVAMYDGNDYKNSQYENTKKGVRALSKMIKKLKKEVKITMEATGTYYLNYAEGLHEKGYNINVVNPLIIKKYSQMRLHRTKTDKADAQLIAEYGYREESRKYIPENPLRRKVRLKLRLIDQFQTDITKNINRIEALNQYPSGAKDMIRILTSINRNLKKRIKRLKQEIQDTIKQDETCKESAERIKKIKGVGDIISSVIIAYFGEFEYFENARQAASFVGIIPTIRQSGSSVRSKGRMSRIGNSYIRKQLTMGARTAMLFNPSCKVLNERLLAKNKSYNERMVAIAHKLLRQIFAVIKNGEEYDPNYVKNTVFCS